MPDHQTGGEGTGPSTVQSHIRLLTQHFRAPARKRLAAEIELLEGRIACCDVQPPRANLISRLIELARREERAGDIDAGWKYLQEAQRQEIYNLGPEALRTRAVTIRNEAEVKLAGWRQTAVTVVLSGSQENNTLEEQREQLYVASLLRDEYNHNIYFKSRLLRRQMALLSAILFSLLVVLLLMLWLTGMDLAHDAGTRLSLKVVVGGLVLGGIGACLSALISFSSITAEQSIPDRLASVTTTAARPLIGIISALVAMLLLNAGSLNEKLPYSAIWVVALAFGFSERLVIGALEKVRG